MGTTPTYGIDWPELADLADGPNALQTLALGVEAVLPNLLWTDAGSAGPGFTALPGEIADCHSLTSYPLVAIGWADLSFEITLVSPLHGLSTQASANIAGYIYLLVNGTQIGPPQRYHSYNTSHVTTVIRRTAPLYKATTVFQVQVKFSVDAGSSTGGAYTALDNWCISQLGAART